MELGKDYKLFLDHICGLMVIDQQGKVVYINDQCADYIKVDAQRSIGKPIKKVFAPSTMEKLLQGDTAYHTNFYFDEGRMSVSTQVQLKKEGTVVGVLEYDMLQDLESLDDLLEKYAKSLREEMKYYREQVRDFKSTKYSINNIIGSSKKVRDLKRQIELSAMSNSTVLITGETGTGKELVAHSIHNLSVRAFSEFVKVNSVGMPESLIESELFGYVEGAFTGAKKGGKKGKFQLADKGTLFIDEINQMPLSLQPKLLRVLQEGEIDPVGSEKSLSVDARIIAATNQDLSKLVKEGDFREDLFYRLNVFPIIVPPLRERIEDLPALVENKIRSLNIEMGKHITKVDENVYERLCDYDWPGNIRELYNVIERAMNFVSGEILTEEVLDVILFRNNNGKHPFYHMENGKHLIEQVRNNAERELIINVLKRFNNNRTKAAQYLGIARPLLYQKMKRLNITNRDISF